MRPSKSEWLMGVADLTAMLSTCERLHVGCVLTDERMEQLWVGYNGGPKGGINSCRHPLIPGGCGCVHAEANAVIKAPGSVEKLAWLTHAPCVTCAVMMVNAHVTKLTYARSYRSEEGIDVLLASGVEVIQRTGNCLDVLRTEKALTEQVTVDKKPRHLRAQGISLDSTVGKIEMPK